MKKVLSYLHNDGYLEIIIAVFYVLAFSMSSPLSVFNGFVKILTSGSILYTDYVFIAGIGAAFFNVAIMMTISHVSIKLLKIKISGPVYAGIIMLGGFSFFGKNPLNTLPLIIGVWLFHAHKRVPFSSLILSLLFSAGISPIVSYPMFGAGLEYYIGIPVGIIIGITIGFIIPAFTAHTMTFHDGYSLYNTGFAIGILGAMIYAILMFAQIDVSREVLYDTENHYSFYIYLYSMAALFIIIAIISDHSVFKSYLKMLKTTGRSVSLYIRDFGISTVLLNLGFLDILITTVLISFNIPMNGILFGSVFSILGFAAYGMHIRNVTPVLIGASISITIKCLIQGSLPNITDNMGEIVAFIFSTGLAPIAGKYGILYGLLGGFVHIIFTPVVARMHGGLVLYNNGFSTGFEAAVFTICGERIFKRERRRRIRNAGKSKD